MPRISAAEREYRARRKETWRVIPGYGGVYEASFDGRIRRVWEKALPKVLYQKEKRGVMIVRLTDATGRRKEQRVHVLVARAWIGVRWGRSSVLLPSSLKRSSLPRGSPKISSEQPS